MSEKRLIRSRTVKDAIVAGYPLIEAVLDGIKGDYAFIVKNNGVGIRRFKESVGSSSREQEAYPDLNTRKIE